MTKVKVLTVKQPYAQLIVTGKKKIETRGNKIHYRGELFIHSSRAFDFNDLEMCHSDPIFKAAIAEPSRLHSGKIIGKVTVIDCKPVELLKPMISTEELHFGFYTDGRFGWIFTNPVLFKKPIEAWGMPGIWETDFEEQEVNHA